MTNALRHEEKALTLTPYLILGFFVLLLALVVRTPASLLQNVLPAGLPLTVNAWGGTVWKGQAVFAHPEGSGFLRWQMQPRRLFAGHLAAQLQAQGALELSGVMELGVKGWQIQGLRGEIPSSLLTLLLPAGWRLPGSVQAEGLALARAGYDKGAGAWQGAGGRLRWQGGPMQFSVSGQTQAVTLPALAMNLRLEGETLVLVLQEETGDLGLAVVRLAPDGAVETQVRERLLRYSPMYRSSGADPDAVVMTSRQTPANP